MPQRSWKGKGHVAYHVHRFCRNDIQEVQCSGSLSNASPDGIPFNQEIVRFALEHYLRLLDHDPEPIPFDAVRIQEIIDKYENTIR